MLIDTHAHLQWATFDKDREKAIRRAKEAGVNYIINIGFDIEGSKRAIELAEKHEELYATVGIHPHNASQFNQKVLDELRELSEDPKVVAIGEIGLDYYRNLSPRQAQKEAFEAQLCLAEELQLPVVIHDREAHADTLKMLSKFQEKINVVMHCFSGYNAVQVNYIRWRSERSIESDFYKSLAGPVTFPRASKLHEIAKQIDSDRILLETDSPWLAPQRMRVRRNEPSFLPFIAEKVAELRGISVEELARVTTENAKRIFALE